MERAWHVFWRYKNSVFGRLLLLFTVVPLLELYLLFQIGARIGGAPTIALVLLTGAAGAALARAEGLRVFREFQQSIAIGRAPADGVVGGVLVLLGGVLLVTPGVMTDVVGLLLLVPATRRWVSRRVVARLQRAVERGTLQVVHTRVDAPMSRGGRGSVGPREPGPVIDVEGETVDPERAPDSGRRLAPDE